MSDLFMSPELYFAELVRKGIENRKLKTAPQVETYLIGLLQHYLDARNLFQSTNSESGRKTPETLAEMYLLAQNSEAAVKAELLKRTGDRALYISGFFGDSLQRKLVDVDYYVEMGGQAYRSLAHCTREDTMAKVYETISFQFIDLVDVLTHISQNSMIQSNQGLLRLYERYVRTGSELAREKLVEMGVLTLPKDQLKLGQ